MSLFILLFLKTHEKSHMGTQILLKSSAVFHNLIHIQLHNYATFFHDPLTATDPAL